MFKKTGRFVEKKWISGPSPNISVQIFSSSPTLIVACEAQKTGWRRGRFAVQLMQRE
jgi:hypothetical protein